MAQGSPLERPTNYKLEGKRVVACPDLLTWGRWFEKAERHVGVDTVRDHRVSTVFLGIDHQWLSGPPLLFETMVFDPTGSDVYQDRYSSWDEAEQGHAAVVAMVESGTLPSY